MNWNVRKHISQRFQCTSIKNRVLSLFDRFMAYYNCMTWIVRKLISPRIQCTSITKRFLSLFDCFTAYYNCMTWNVRKLIFASFPCTSITNRFNCLIDRFTVYYNCMIEVSENWYLRDFSERVAQIVFLAYLIVLRLITTVWPEMSEKSCLRYFSVQ